MGWIMLKRVSKMAAQFLVVMLQGLKPRIFPALFFWPG
jgi:hypothetical protein